MEKYTSNINFITTTLIYNIQYTEKCFLINHIIKAFIYKLIILHYLTNHFLSIRHLEL